MTPPPALLGLLAALASAGGGQTLQPTASTPPMTLEDSRRLSAEHDRLCVRFAAALDALEAGRRDFEGAADREAALKRWAVLFAPAHQVIGEQDDLWNEHNSRVHALEVYVLTGAALRVANRDRKPETFSADLDTMHKANDEMRSRKDRLLERFWDVGDRYKEAAAKLAADRETAKQDRALALGLAAAGAAVAALLAWAARRYVKAAPEAFQTALPPAGPEASARALPALIGGNIDVVRPIGRGGMGEVYEGLDRTLQRRVALKRLRPELTGSPDDLSRLLKEARLVATLKHPNIVAIHSVEKEAGQVFLVFEYVDGPTLTTLLSQRRQLPWPEALKVFSGAAAALQAAHERNIVHRDLKPGNIMLDSKGVVKVMDFGIASEAAFAVSRMTRSGAWGTPPYMSPEQELGEVNTGVDLFALNVVLYEMLTGELPFTGPNFLAQKRERVYIPVSQAVPALPKALDAFFATAFDPDPLKRIHDAAALSAAAGALV
ncbi:serine/threonine protein kinase [bacterium]|nr:MAG: serine/threonine protein kinase [bacterium]